MSRYLFTVSLCLISTAALAQTNPRNRAANDANQAEGGQGKAGAQAGDQPGAGAKATTAPNPMFAALDANGDGIINARELRSAVAALKALDTDGDGNITLAEASPPSGTIGEPAQMTNQMFTQSDKNGDGQLTAAEMPPGAARMFQSADRDGNGAINLNEFNAMMQAMQGQFGGAGGRGGNDSRSMLQQYDRNGDGRLTPDEVPPQLGAMLQGADRNGDRAIDISELQGMAEQMRTGRGFGGERGPGGEPPMGNRRGPRGDR
jgi:Ca2+-binding EF-hand superfamily protein